MGKFKLTYFNVKGVGEPIRYLFAYNETQFEDDRIEIDDWAKHKDGKPFGQVPVLDAGNGVLLTQSVAIARYLGRTFGLVSSNELKNAQLDGLVDHMQDLHNKLYAVIRQTREAEAQGKSTVECQAAMAAFENEMLPFFLTKFEAVASGGAFHGDTISWVDIYFAGWMDVMETRLKKPLLTSYPNLLKLKQKIESNPGVQSYLERRPFNNQ